WVDSRVERAKELNTVQFKPATTPAPPPAAQKPAPDDADPAPYIPEGVFLLGEGWDFNRNEEQIGRQTVTRHAIPLYLGQAGVQFGHASLNRLLVDQRHDWLSLFPWAHYQFLSQPSLSLQAGYGPYSAYAGSLAAQAGLNLFNLQFGPKAKPRVEFAGQAVYAHNWFSGLRRPEQYGSDNPAPPGESNLF